MHTKHVIDGINKDLVGKSRDYYLDLAGDWKDPEGFPIIERFGKFNVVRDDLIDIGSKGRFADLLVERVQTDHIVYVAPRCGYAGISLAKVCNRHGKKLTLFAPAAKVISDHQLVCYELGANMKFARIAAMPVLNKYAREYAERVGALFVPLGLKHELVTAAIVAVCDTMIKAGHDPKEVWCAISTGVLSRGLQIGFHNAKFTSVAVSRNLKAGELGTSAVRSYRKPFQDPCDVNPPFPSVLTYDAKAWEEMQGRAEDGAYFWNVAGEVYPKNPELKKQIKSAREWGDKSDLELTLV